MLHLLASATVIVESNPTLGRVLRGAIGVLLLFWAYLGIRSYRKRFGRKP